MFSTEITEINYHIQNIDPIAYGKSRNFVNGAVTKLSPYISRGMISTRKILLSLLQKGYQPHAIEAFIKELAWREYFQRVWQHLGDGIDEDIKNIQPEYKHQQISKNIIAAQTGIQAVDQAIHTLYDTGYMHNHQRMYVASIACNIAKAHWLMPAQWLYYYLLDADWASNACSWQWVAGSFSNKKYYANQENINHYTGTVQRHTFLDIDYTHFNAMAIPDELKALTDIQLHTALPKQEPIMIDASLPVYVYNFYNVDIEWDSHVPANRVFLMEPSFYKKYPVSDKVIEFVISLSKNINGIQIFTGEFPDLQTLCKGQTIHYKEHPTNLHYKGIAHNREWIFPEVSGYFPSFFSYWKKCEKYLFDLL